MGITEAQFRAPEDMGEAGGIHSKTLHTYALSFAEGMRSGRVVAPDREP